MTPIKPNKIEWMQIHPPSNPVPAGELTARIHQALDAGLTGLAFVNFQTGKTLRILAQGGKVRQVYLRHHRIPALDWELPLTMQGEGTVEIHPMPSRALMFRKIILEELETPKPQPSGTSQLKTMFDLAERNASPTLFHIQWASAEGFVLVAGRSIPLRHAVLLTHAGAEEAQVALDHIPAWEEAQCLVTVYRANIMNQAWFEIHLNILFEWYCQNVLAYYGQLTGTVMVRSILQSVSVLAEINHWNISTKDNRLKDVSIFATAAEAGNAYREILSTIKSRIEPIVGSSLTQNLMKQTRDSAKDIYKSIQEIFGLIGEV